MKAIQLLPMLDPRIPKWNAAELEERHCPICGNVGTARFQRPDHLVVRACSCGTWFVSPAPSSEALSEFYATYAETHRRASHGDTELTSIVRAQKADDSLVLTELATMLSLNGKRVLDVGCGRGSFLHLVEKLGAFAYGVDLDRQSIAFAHDHLGLGNTRVGTVFDLDEQPFDVLTMLDFIEHPLEVMPTLERAHALLKPQGILGIWTPNASRFDREAVPLALQVDLEHMQYLSFSSVHAIARKLGFEVIHLEACCQADLGVTKPPSPDSSWASLRGHAKRAIKSVELELGLTEFRRRWTEPTRRWEERRGSYCLMAFLEKG